MMGKICSHSRKIPGHWATGSEDMPDDWHSEYEEPTVTDIDLHRYKCTQCGEVKYYSNAAREYYENGVKSNVQGLNGNVEEILVP
jgi:hypothetical protein